MSKPDRNTSTLRRGVRRITAVDSDSAAERSEALGRTIKVLRTDRGLERKELAELAGISYSYLAEIESGTKQPSSQVLAAIADALGLRSHELLQHAEQRRDRVGAPGDDPWWLTGQRRQPMMAAAPVKTLMAPYPGGSAGPNLAGFVGEITDLAEHLTPHEREVVLGLARKLAQQIR